MEDESSGGSGASRSLDRHTFIGHELPDLAGLRASLAVGTGMIGAAVRAGYCVRIS